MSGCPIAKHCEVHTSTESNYDFVGPMVMLLLVMNVFNMQPQILVTYGKYTSEKYNCEGTGGRIAEHLDKTYVHVGTDRGR